MKIDSKKIIKYLGNVITLIAVFFILKKLVSSDIDYATLFKVKNLIPILIVIVVQAIIVITNNYPWKMLVELFSNVTIPFKDSIVVYVKLNLLKYVPGNVFQYVGRNGLAVEKGIPHIKVASATLADVGMTILSALAISLFFLFDYIWTFITHNNYMNILFIGLIVVFFICLCLFVFFRKKILTFFKENSYLLKPKSLKTIFICFFFIT